MLVPAQQPRWLLLSVFLFLWSVSSAFRRDARSMALGLGVDARAHFLNENILPRDLGRRQQLVGIPDCAVICASRAGDSLGCGEGLNLGCACHSPSFLPDTVNCMDKNCSSIDEQIGQQALQSACQAVGTSTTSSQTSTSFSVSSTSITSGPPPICTTVSPTSGSDTTTVSVTVTITSSGADSSTSASDTASVTSTDSTSTTASDTETSTVSAPVVTATTMVTTSGTVSLTGVSTTQPVTTITSTSTLGGVPTDGTGASGDGTGQNGAAGDNMRMAVAAALYAAAMGAGAMLVL